MVVTIMWDPSCPVCYVKPAESLGFPAMISPTALVSGSVSDGGLGCVAARGPGAASPPWRDLALRAMAGEGGSSSGAGGVAGRVSSGNV